MFVPAVGRLGSAGRCVMIAAYRSQFNGTQPIEHLSEPGSTARDWYGEWAAYWGAELFGIPICPASMPDGEKRYQLARVA